MKHIATLSIAAALAGCAGLQSQDPMPHFNYDQQAVVAPGFPIEWLKAPDGMRMVYADYENTDRLPFSEGGGTFHERAFTWATGSDGTAVMMAMFRRGDGLVFQPAMNVDGREMVNGREVGYATETGRYFDLVFWRLAIPYGSPRCAIGTAVTIHSPDLTKEVIGEFVAGLPCDEVESLTDDEKEAHRQRTYQAFGLR